MTKTLKDTLKEIQILLGKPQKKIAGTLKYYLDFFTVTKNGKESEEPPTKVEKMKSIRHGKITWTDIKNPSRKEISELAQKYPFHPLHLEDCISKGQFPKLEQNDEDKYLFLLLRFPSYHSQEGKITINQICFFLGKDYLVTIHENTTDRITDLFNACQASWRQRQAYFDKSSGHLLYVIIDHLTNDLSPILQAIIQEVDVTEDIVFDDKISGVYQIGQLRQKIISLRRALGPLRTLLEELTTKINQFSSFNLSVYMENITHRVEKAWETLEEARETVDVYKDADFTISTEKTNRILAVLTIIFTLSIPATVIGALYGMNILLPGGSETGSWMFWGKYTSFIVILIIAAIPALYMAWYFKKRGWF